MEKMEQIYLESCKIFESSLTYKLWKQMFHPKVLFPMTSFAILIIFI